MIDLSKYKNTKIGVFGLGKTGSSTIKAFLKAGSLVYAWDDNKDKVLQLKSEINNDNLYLSDIIDPTDIKKLEFMIISPGIPGNFPKPHSIFLQCQRYTIPIESDIDLLQEFCKGSNFIGITGTNGKSTTSSLIQHILSSNKIDSFLGGNIGIPVTDLPQNNSKNSHYITEISSYQLELSDKLRFNIAILMNVTPDHLDRYKSFDDYYNTKKSVFNNQEIGDFSIISLNTKNNLDVFDSLVAKNKQKVIPISSLEILKNGVSVLNKTIHDNYFDNKSYTFAPPISLFGTHNAENIAAAYVVAKILDVKIEDIISSITSFAGLQNRTEVVLKTKNLIFVNDSKATNIDATIKALDSFSSIYWIAGGVLKGQDVNKLSNHLKNVLHCFLIGDDGKKFIPMLNLNKKIYTHSETMEEALLFIKNSNISGTVLLSPACASFDQYNNYEERGKAFKNLVTKYFYDN
ncbi:MAG: UDP-N-acetylmuramoylalanine--D-glutamate ligase [Candidatus Midichloriaceae bacterium]|jgi:UDP-N-acetylmuramoylalanine--D-glutamate ligase